MNNLLSYCGLFDVRIDDCDKNLPVWYALWHNLIEYFIFGVVYDSIWARYSSWYRIPYLCNHREYQKLSISKVNYEITNNLFSEKERFLLQFWTPFLFSKLCMYYWEDNIWNTTELLFYPINLTILCIKYVLYMVTKWELFRYELWIVKWKN